MSSVTATMSRPKRNDLAVKVDAYVLRLAKILAAHEDTSIAELISDALLPVLIKRLEKMGVPFPPKPAEADE